MRLGYHAAVHQTLQAVLDGTGGHARKHGLLLVDPDVEAGDVGGLGVEHVDHHVGTLEALADQCRRPAQHFRIGAVDLGQHRGPGRRAGRTLHETHIQARVAVLEGFGGNAQLADHFHGFGIAQLLVDQVDAELGDMGTAAVVVAADLAGEVDDRRNAHIGEVIGHQWMGARQGAEFPRHPVGDLDGCVLGHVEGDVEGILVVLGHDRQHHPARG